MGPQAWANITAQWCVRGGKPVGCPTMRVVILKARWMDYYSPALRQVPEEVVACLPRESGGP